MLKIITNKKYIAVITIVFLGYVSYLQFLPNTTSQDSLTDTSLNSYRVYSNTDFSFQFKYPEVFSEMKPHNQKSCAKSFSWNDISIKTIPLAKANNLSVLVVCEKLTTNLLNQFKKEGVYKREDLVLQGKNLHSHYFVTSTGYEWRVLQVQLDDGRYLEITYTYRSLPEYYKITESEWNDLISSILFKEESQKDIKIAP